MQVNSTFVHFLNKARLLKFLNVTTALSYEGTVFKIPINKSVGYSHCVTFEPWLMRLMVRLKKYLEPDKSFVDVGVNVGQSLLIFKALLPSARYVGFEPNPVCYEYTSNLIKINHIENSTVHPFGLSDNSSTAELIFFHDSADDSSASVISGFRKEPIVNTRNILLKRGDELKDWETIKPGIIKIDTEGAELEVIAGLVKVIDVHRPCIVCEVLPAANQQQEFRKRRHEELQHILKRNGYVIYHIDKEADLKLVGSFSDKASTDACNYLLLPREITPPDPA